MHFLFRSYQTPYDPTVLTTSHFITVCIFVGFRTNSMLEITYMSYKYVCRLCVFVFQGNASDLGTIVKLLNKNHDIGGFKTEESIQFFYIH